MALTYRLLNAEDYDDFLLKWWKDWKFPAPPRDCLPRNGVVVVDEEGPLYAGFMYFTDSPIVWVEWVVSDRMAAPARKRGGLELLLEVFTQMADGGGAKYVFTSTERAAFRNGLVRCGFVVGDTGISQLVKTIRPTTGDI